MEKKIKCQNMKRKCHIFQPVFPNKIPYENCKARIFLIYANSITDISVTVTQIDDHSDGRAVLCIRFREFIKVLGAALKSAVNRTKETA